MSTPAEAAVQERLARWLDGAATPAEAAALSRDLVADPALCRQLVALVQVERGVRSALGAPRTGRRSAGRPARRRLRRPAARRWAYALAAAIAATLLVGLPVLGALRSRPTPPADQDQAAVPGHFDPTGAVAEVVAADGLDAGSGAVAGGTRLRAGAHLATAALGAADLRLIDGTRLHLAGATRVTFAEPSAWQAAAAPPAPGAPAAVGAPAPPAVLTLVDGGIELAGHHAPAAPFVVATPRGAVALHGTVVALEAADGETTVAVREGWVTVQDRAVQAGHELLLPAQGPPREHALGAPWGRLLRVGAHQPVAQLADLPALAPGDVVELDAGTYHEGVRLTASGTACRPIVLRAAPAAAVVLDGTGLLLSGVGSVPRALLQVEGHDWVIQGLTVVQAHNGQNAAGIRCMGGGTTTIAGCRIRGCDDGVSVSRGAVRISDCEIIGCGSGTPDGLSHGIYADAAEAIVIERCLVADSRSGVGIKAGAHALRIDACRIQDNADGEVSLLPPPTPRPDDRIVLRGDVIRGTSARGGNHERVVALQAEGPAPAQGGIVVAFCTIQGADARALLLDTRVAPVALLAWDNLLVGTPRVWAGAGPVRGGGNWVDGDAVVPAAWTGTHAGDPGFRDGLQGAGRLAPGAPAQGQALPLPVELGLAPPAWQPPAAAGEPARERAAAHDPGALEGP